MMTAAWLLYRQCLQSDMSFCEGISVESLTCDCKDTLHEDCHIRKGGRITFHDHSLSRIASHL